MDVELWGSRVHSSKHIQAAHLNSEEDEDAGTCFPCPFCYVEIELSLLCVHLQEEHCFDVHNAVCPICAANLGRDVIGHFTMQHTQSLKRRRKSQRSGFWINSSPMMGREQRDLSSFLDPTTAMGRGNPSGSALDPLLTSFICNIPLPEREGSQQAKCHTEDPSTTSNMKSKEALLPDETSERDFREKSQKAEFLQQLVFSTIF